MTKIEKLEHEIKKLSRKEFASFRDWFRRYEADAWDLQMAEDVKAGKLDKLAEKAVASHNAGKTKEL